jgi:hypothetical protein
VEVVRGKGDRPQDVNRHAVDQVHAVDAISPEHGGQAGTNKMMEVEGGHVAPDVLPALPLNVGRTEAIRNSRS